MARNVRKLVREGVMAARGNWLAKMKQAMVDMQARMMGTHSKPEAEVPTGA